MATKRGYYRGEMLRAIDNIEMALTHITRVIDAYKDPHPEVSETAKQCGDALVMVAETILKLHESV